MESKQKTPCKILGTQCFITDYCQNTKCFFKQRTLGRSYWLQFDDNGNIISDDHITEKYGPYIIPDIRGELGMNEIAIYCNDFINSDWQVGWYTGFPDEKPYCHVTPPKCKKEEKGQKNGK